MSDLEGGYLEDVLVEVEGVHVAGIEVVLLQVSPVIWVRAWVRVRVRVTVRDRVGASVRVRDRVGASVRVLDRVRVVLGMQGVTRRVEVMLQKMTP